MPVTQPERPVLSSLHADVAALATPERAKANTWFFKTGPGQYGEGDQFAGLTLPQVRTLVKQYRDLSIDDCEELLHSLGFAVVRVRHFGTTARIEVPTADLARLWSESVRPRCTLRQSATLRSPTLNA